MIKVRFGRRKEDAGLHPLSEKEIQKKLYGAYSESIKAPVEEQPPAAEPRWAGEAPAKERVAIKKPSSFPWKKIASALIEILDAVGGTLKRFLPKLSTKWSMGTGILIALFLSIHALNLYRAQAMRNPTSNPVAPKNLSEPRPEPETQPSAPPFSRSPRRILTAAQKSPLPSASLPAPKKSYVIQVATYANSGDAERLSDQMTQAGFQSFVQFATRSGGRTFYLVFLGRYGTSQEAEARLKEFRNQSIAQDFPDSFIRIL